MTELAIKKMTLAEFLRWEDGTDTRYELLGGTVFAMAPPAPAHGFLAARLCARIEAGLRSRPPCMAQIEAGIAKPDRDDTCYVADLAVTCTPTQRGQELLSDPVLIVEILSPGTALYDRQTKVADYRRIPSVQEILLIDSASVFAEVLRRAGEQWVTELVQGRAATLSLPSIGLTVTMSELYEGIDAPDAGERLSLGPSPREQCEGVERH
jgi:Uma2 family endonuclease